MPRSSPMGSVCLTDEWCRRATEDEFCGRDDVSVLPGYPWAVEVGKWMLLFTRRVGMKMGTGKAVGMKGPTVHTMLVHKRYRDGI